MAPRKKINKKKKATTKKKAPAKKKAVAKKVVKKNAPVKSKAVAKKKAPAKKKTSAKKSTVKKSTPKKVSNMAKKKKKSGGKRRSVKRESVIDAVISSTIAAGGAVGISVLANKVPIQNAKVKAAIPLAAGIALSSTKFGRDKIGAKVATVAMAVGALSLLRQFVPTIPMLAGEEDIYPYDDQMGIPYDITSQMGEPVSILGEEDNIIEEDFNDDAYNDGMGSVVDFAV